VRTHQTRVDVLGMTQQRRAGAFTRDGLGWAAAVEVYTWSASSHQRRRQRRQHDGVAAHDLTDTRTHAR
jgi:hypothetical protein